MKIVSFWYGFCFRSIWSENHEGRRAKMRKYLALTCSLFILVAGFSSCRPYAGLEFYSRTPRSARTHPNHVLLIKHRPRRGYIELGEVWIRPTPRMSRRSVENKLRKKAARMGADAVLITVDKYSRNGVAYRRYRRGTMVYRERLIGGVAIRFQ